MPQIWLFQEWITWVFLVAAFQFKPTSINIYYWRTWCRHQIESMYPPLSTSLYNPGPAVEYAIFSLHLAVISSLLGAINFIITILKMRRPGMRLHNMPLFVWSVLVTTFLLLLSLPVLAGAITILLLEWTCNFTFFHPQGGGEVILFQYLFSGFIV